MSATDVGKLEQENARLGVALSDAYGVLGKRGRAGHSRFAPSPSSSRKRTESKFGVFESGNGGCAWIRPPYRIPGVHVGGRERNAGGENRLHPIFQPNSDETHRFRCLVSSERFNLTGIGGHQEDRDPVAVGAGRGARARGLPAGKRGRGSRQPPDAESRAPLLKQCESRPEAR